MIRVAVVLNKYDAGGIESVVTNYYRNFDREKVQCDFFYDENSDMPYLDELKELGAGLYPMPSYTHFLSYRKKHVDAFRENGYHIVHAHVSCMSFFSLWAAKKAGVRVRICHAHTVADKSEGWKKCLIKYILRPLNKLVATHFFACGKDVGDWMYGSTPYEIIPNAIDTEKFKYDSSARTSLRKELGIPDDALVIGHVGRFIPEKNHEFIKRLAERIPDAYFLMVGDGPLFDEISGSNIVKTGVRSDVGKLYSAMDVFLLPSFSEGLPVVVLEAQANGLPCVCSTAVTGEADFGGMEICELDENKWIEAVRKSKRKTPEIPDKWDIKKAAGILEKFYLDNNDYVSVYVRNINEGPACYYRIGQYIQPDWKINNAYSAKQYRHNFDMSPGILKKLYQGWLLAVTNHNRKKSMSFDIKYHPVKTIIQREMVPKVISPGVFSKLKKLKNIIWDFDDDIREEGECSEKEFNFLKEHAETIVVTSDYLNEMVDGKAMVLPTTVRSEVDVETLIEQRKKTFYDDFRPIWLGSFSNLDNLELVNIPNLRVVCNRPYEGNVINVPWTRDTADDELKKAHVGLMPLKDEKYNYGKGGFKIIQYMSVGLPVMASAIGFNREILRPEFAEIDSFDVSLISSDINKWEEMSRASYKAYKERFSFEHNLKVWQEILTDKKQ